MEGVNRPQQWRLHRFSEPNDLIVDGHEPGATEGGRGAGMQTTKLAGGRLLARRCRDALQRSHYFDARDQTRDNVLTTGDRQLELRGLWFVDDKFDQGRSIKVDQGGLEPVFPHLLEGVR